MGRVIAVSQIKEVPSTKAGNPPIKKRELYLDTTAYDFYTGAQIGDENKVVLEFGGDKLVEKLGALNLKKDDIAAVTFGLQGNPYTDSQTGKNRVFTAIRSLDIEKMQQAGQQGAQTAQPAPQPQPAPAPEPTPQPTTQNDNGSKEEPLPF